MSRYRPLSALLLASTLLLSGCPNSDGPVRASGPHFVTPSASDSPGEKSPTFSPRPDEPTVPEDPTPTPSATTTRSPKPKPKPKPSQAVSGLQRKTGVRAVALTFDDGPHPVWTPKLLDQLRSAGVKATFCLVGVEVRQHPKLVARIVREGHALCNHSWRHDLDLGKKTEAQIRADLARTNREIRQAVPGASIRYYRQPGGNWTPAVIKIAKELHMVPLHWGVDPRDWAKPSAEEISKRVTTRARAGSIVLMHDGGGDRSNTLAACPSIISTLKRKFGIIRLK